MNPELINALVVAVLTGAASGLITWGAMRVELRWLRRDVDETKARLNALPCQFGRHGRRAYDYCNHLEDDQP